MSDHLSNEHKLIFIQYLSLMHSKLIKHFETDPEGSKLNALMCELAEDVDKLDMETNMSEQLGEFVKTLSLGIREDAGSADHHSKRYTFYPEDVKETATIILWCKMLAPLFGAIMTPIKKKADNKESFCMLLMDKLVNRCFPVMSKLMDYVINQAKKHVDINMSSIMQGITEESLAQLARSNLLVRQFVNVNLSVPDGNIIIYIDVGIKGVARSIRTAIRKDPTLTRLPAVSGDEEGNESQIETDSMITKKTAEIPILIKVAVPRIIENCINFYDIDRSTYIDCIEYYGRKGRPIVPTRVNRDILVLFYAEKLGGGRGISMLHRNEMTDLVVLTQMILSKMSGDYAYLIHMLSAVQANETGSNEEDERIRTIALSDENYNRCYSYFKEAPYGADEKVWGNNINSLINELLGSRWMYNSAPELWESQAPLNGKLIPKDATINIVSSVSDLYRRLQIKEVF